MIEEWEAEIDAREARVRHAFLELFYGGREKDPESFSEAMATILGRSQGSQEDWDLAKLGHTFCVNADYLKTGLHLKAEPNNTSETIMVIGAGHMVMDLGRNGEWEFVGPHRGGGNQGYVPIYALSNKDLDGLPCGSELVMNREDEK